MQISDAEILIVRAIHFRCLFDLPALSTVPNVAYILSRRVGYDHPTILLPESNNNELHCHPSSDRYALFTRPYNSQLATRTP